MINFILPVQEMRETKHMDGTMNHFGHLPIYTDGSYTEPIPVPELNTKFHEGPVSITGTMIYFSSESFNRKLFVNDKVNKLRFGQVNLFKATNESGKWVDIVPCLLIARATLL
jgi:hypothetical protein